MLKCPRTKAEQAAWKLDQMIEKQKRIVKHRQYGLDRAWARLRELEGRRYKNNFLTPLDSIKKV